MPACPRFSPSLMCADPLRMAEQLDVINRRATLCHIDIMDGHYVKNIALSPDFVARVKERLSIPIDVHLMVEDPDDYIGRLAAAGCGYISIHADVIERVQRIGVKYETLRHQAPLLQDKNGTLVQTLLGVYERVTGRKAAPVAIGGGTYARALKNGVAFGPEMADDEPVVHQADEYITFERVQLLLDLYKEAIRELTT